MESKKANLIIDVAKNVVEQYREQLANSIRERKLMDLDAYEYECTVERAERALASVDKILENFEQSIFDGKITEEATYQAIYTSKGRELKEMLYKEKPILSDIELELAQMGTVRVLKQIGIPEYSIYPIISDIMERTRDVNYTDGKLNEERIKFLNDKEFNIEGKYRVGELSINNLLSTKVTLDTGVLTYTEDTPMLYSQGKSLYLQVDGIKDIIDEYIKEGINERNLESLEEQNNFVNETFNTVRYVGTIGGATSQNYSMYYYERFKSVFDHNSYGGNDYYRTAREVKKETQNNDFESKKELESLKQQKENLERLAKLNEEEQQLLNRLIEIQNEKEKLLSTVSGIESFDNKISSKPTYTKPNKPGRKYFDEFHYIENGVHYHLPDWEKINSETHTQLK